MTTTPNQLPSMNEIDAPPAPQPMRERALPPAAGAGASGGERGDAGSNLELRLRAIERAMSRISSGGEMLRQEFEIRALLSFLSHEQAFPNPAQNIGDIQMAAQNLADELQKRGFFPNTPEYSPVPRRVLRRNQAPQPIGSAGRQGDDPQGGDHRVQVSYPEMR